MSSVVLDLLNKRHASRAISEEIIPEEKIQSILEAVRLTPSCANKQPWHFLMIESDEGLATARQALTGGNLDWAVTAPLLVVVYASVEDDCQPPDGRVYHRFDCGMSVMNLMLEATAQGLTARPMAGFKPDQIREAFKIDDRFDIVVMLAVGIKGEDETHVPEKYKGIEDKPRQRKELSEIMQRV
ncbi:nitroreductase family protein [bacterium]|nr:nitroreductase family protein [bacterium]